VPETVSVALAELAGEVLEGLLALAVGIELQVMAAMMEADVTAACGPKGRHDSARTATRLGHGAGSVTLSGRWVSVTGPRRCAVDGSRELSAPSYELFSQSKVPAQTVEVCSCCLGGFERGKFVVDGEHIPMLECRRTRL
jgi:putative transposase